MSFLQPQVKGSIPVGSQVGGAASVSALAVGADGTALTADSTAPSGLKYAVPVLEDVGASVTATGSQTIPTGSTTNIAFDAEDWDTSGFHDNAVNNDRLTVPVGLSGKYLVTLNVTFDSSAAGSRIVAVHKNGSGADITDTRDGTGGGLGTSVSISGFLNLVAGDFITGIVHQNTGGNLNINSARRLQIQKVG